jgi:tetratricopeptide (TPR) repeat protein
MYLISKAEPGKPSMLERLKFKVLEFHTSTTSNQNPTRGAQPDRYTLRLANELQCIKRKRVTEGVLRAVLSSQSNDDDPYLEYLAQQFPTGEFENWARCQELLPHIDVAYNSVPVTSKSWEAWAQIFTNVAWYLWKQGDCDIALIMITEAFVVRQTLFGCNDHRTLLATEILAGVLSSRGNHHEAVELNRRALKGFKKTLGSLHPFTLSSLSNLALALQRLGNSKQSEALSRLALRGSKIVLGSSHADTLISMSNLALVLQHQGKYKQATKLYQQAFNGFRETLGKRHPSTLVSMSNLGLVLQCQGRYTESEELHRQSLEGKIEELGWHHPSTLTGMNNLALALQNQSKCRSP